MTAMTIDELREFVRACLGEDGPGEEADFVAATFEALGCDSLALLELSAVIAHQFDVRVPDGALAPTMTPRDAVTLVNGWLRRAHDER